MNLNCVRTLCEAANSQRGAVSASAEIETRASPPAPRSLPVAHTGWEAVAAALLHQMQRVQGCRLKRSEPVQQLQPKQGELAMSTGKGTLASALIARATCTTTHSGSSLSERLRRTARPTAETLPSGSGQPPWKRCAASGTPCAAVARIPEQLELLACHCRGWGAGVQVASAEAQHEMSCIYSHTGSGPATLPHAVRSVSGFAGGRLSHILLCSVHKCHRAVRGAPIPPFPGRLGWGFSFSKASASLLRSGQEVVQDLWWRSAGDALGCRRRF